MASSRRILVIDDSADGLDALRMLLEAWGHRVSGARTGREGVDQALAEQPEVIILDLGLPDLDGCEVARRIRSEPWGSTVTIIAYSGFHRLAEQAKDAGCDHFLLKPAVDELQALIDVAAERLLRRG